MLSALGDVLPPFIAILVVFGCIVVLPVLASLVASKVRPPAVPVNAARRTPGGPPARAPQGSGRRSEEPHRLVQIVPYFDPRSAETRYEAWCACGDKELYLPSRQSCDAWLTVHRSVCESIDNTRRQA